MRLNPRDQTWSLDRKQFVILSNPMADLRHSSLFSKWLNAILMCERVSHDKKRVVGIASFVRNKRNTGEYTKELRH